MSIKQRLQVLEQRTGMRRRFWYMLFETQEALDLARSVGGVPCGVECYVGACPDEGGTEVAYVPWRTELPPGWSDADWEALG